MLSALFSRPNVFSFVHILPLALEVFVGIVQYISTLIQTGLGNLAAYLAAHVLLCLLPAFFIAGALMVLIPKEAVTRYLGRESSKWISYPAALLAGFVLAVCSCTILPLFASIYKKGAGLGPALTFMFFAPASNILAILFTGVQIGMDIAFARILLCMVFGVSIGLDHGLAFPRRRCRSCQCHQWHCRFRARCQSCRSHLGFLCTVGCGADCRYACRSVCSRTAMSRTTSLLRGRVFSRHGWTVSFRLTRPWASRA